MSRESHDDNCEGCKPALIDTTTGQPLAPDSPMMQAVMGVWAKTTLPQRQAWHRVTCLMSRDPEDVRLAEQFVQDVQNATKGLN